MEIHMLIFLISAGEQREYNFFQLKKFTQSPISKEFGGWCLKKVMFRKEFKKKKKKQCYELAKKYVEWIRK